VCRKNFRESKKKRILEINKKRVLDKKCFKFYENYIVYSHFNKCDIIIAIKSFFKKYEK